MDTIMPKFLVSVLFFMFISCVNSNPASERFKTYEKGEITLPSGKKLKVYIARNEKEQRAGLSGVKPDEFGDNETMIFLDDKPSSRQFWMPDTHFDLDIIFLNNDLYVLDIHRNLEHYPHTGPDAKIPRSKRVFSQHVLEIKSSSPLAKEIKYGMKLNWTSSNRLQKE